MGQHPQVRRIVLYLVMIIGVVAVAGALATRRPRDFPVYMKAAERIVRGEQIYRPDDPPAFTYPPFFALPFAIWLPFPPRAQVLLWSLVNCGLLLATIALVARWIGPQIRSGVANRGPHARWAWLAIGLLSGRFLISPLEYQAHDLIVLLLVLLGGMAWAAGRQGWAGGWMGLAAACKATPLLFLPLFAEQKRWRACMALVATLTIATILPDLAFPNRDGRLWCVSWYGNFVSKMNVGASPEAAGAWARWDTLNQSLSATLFRLSTPADKAFSHLNACLWPLTESQLRIVTIVVELGVLGVLVLALWPHRKTGWNDDDQAFVVFGQVGATLCGMLLLSPVSSKHHFCALVVPIAFCVVYFLYRRRDSVVGAGLLLVLLLGTLGAKDIVGNQIGNRLQAWGGLTICTLGCLLATSWALLRGPQFTATWNEDIGLSTLTASLPSDLRSSTGRTRTAA